MDTQTQAQIYLADQRGCSQLDPVRSVHSFNFGAYVAEGREPFGALRLLNDDVLKPGRGVTMRAESDTLVMLLPLVGGLEYKSQAGSGFLSDGEVLHLSLATGMAYEVLNPYETESINYLALWFNPSGTAFAPASQVLSFDLRRKNTWLSLTDSAAENPANGLSVRGFIGRFDGRQEAVYPVATRSAAPPSGVFVFVLSGAFEVQNRLLHARDGLALTTIQADCVEVEALSNDALLLLFDVPLVA